MRMWRTQAAVVVPERSRCVYAAGVATKGCPFFVMPSGSQQRLVPSGQEDVKYALLTTALEFPTIVAGRGLDFAWWWP